MSAGDSDALHDALDWLGARQDAIERLLAHRHLVPGGGVLFDLFSSYLTGTPCPPAARGYSRDGRRGSLQITYGLVSSAAGLPVAVEVFPGNFSDAAAFSAALATVRERRGLTEPQAQPGLSFITALRDPEVTARTRAGLIRSPPRRRSTAST